MLIFRRTAVMREQDCYTVYERPRNFFEQMHQLIGIFSIAKQSSSVCQIGLIKHQILLKLLTLVKYSEH
jgi:hypothetical protein